MERERKAASRPPPLKLQLCSPLRFVKPINTPVTVGKSFNKNKINSLRKINHDIERVGLDGLLHHTSYAHTHTHTVPPFLSNPQNRKSCVNDNGTLFFSVPSRVPLFVCRLVCSGNGSSTEFAPKSPVTRHLVLSPQRDRRREREREGTQHTVQHTVHKREGFYFPFAAFRSLDDDF